MDSIQPPERKSEKTMVGEARLAHPHCKTDVGALLEEICTEKDSPQRDQAAWVYGARRYRRGFQRLKKFVLASQDKWEGPRGMSYPGYLIYFALGKMDTPESHQFLVEQSKSLLPSVRDAARYGMAWEKDQFDVDLLLTMLDQNGDEMVLYDVLYAIDIRGWQEGWDRARETITPFLSDPNRMVVAYAIKALRNDPVSRDAILALGDHQEHMVRDEVEESVEWWSWE